jgi:hypothetical protein
MDPVPAAVVVGWLILHLGALASAWATRVAAGSRLEFPFQLSCFLAMTGVGAAGWTCHALEIGLWVPSGVTLVAMVLTAVIDFRRAPDTHSPVHSVAGP